MKEKAGMCNKINYLAEMYELDKIEAKDINIGEKFEYTIKGKAYRDPDMESKKLYERWKEFLDKILKGRGNKFQIQIEKDGLAIRVKNNNKIFVLSSDYIGPSKYYAAKAFRNSELDEKEEMAKIFNICRCFEGHIIWPKGQLINMNDKCTYIPYGPNSRNNINMSRGGPTGVFDRFDVTLYLLDRYYEFLKEREYSCKRIFDRAEAFIYSCKDDIDVKENGYRLFNIFLSFELSSDWLFLFNDFNGFIETFKLQNFLKNGEPVIWGGGDKLMDEKEYIGYVDNCKKAIEDRGEQLSN